MNAKAKENFDEVLAAHADQRPSNELSRTEQQDRWVARQLERCPRCGEHVVMLFPAMGAVLCNDCTNALRELDPEKIWFTDLVAENNRKAREQGAPVDQD